MILTLFICIIIIKTVQLVGGLSEDAWLMLLALFLCIALTRTNRQLSHLLNFEFFFLPKLFLLLNSVSRIIYLALGLGNLLSQFIHLLFKLSLSLQDLLCLRVVCSHIGNPELLNLNSLFLPHDFDLGQIVM